jgi:hypothetical protein
VDSRADSGYRLKGGPPTIKVLGLRRAWALSERVCEKAMTRPFKGKIATDVRDSEQDWGAYTQASPPERSPNVVYLHRDGPRG